MEEVKLSVFTYLVLAAFFAQVFFLTLQKRGYNIMPVRLGWKWSNITAFTGIVGLLLEYPLEGRPFAVILGVSFIIVFMLDTIWTRLAIAAVSSAMPRVFLTPKEVSSSWRPGKYFYGLKRTIEEAGFRKVLSIRTDMPGRSDVAELGTCFLSHDGKTLLHVSFVMARKELMTSFAFTSKNSGGKYFVSSNQPRVDGLLFPSNYERRINPWLPSFGKLFKFHEKRVACESLEPLPAPTVRDIRNFFQLLEKENVARGILTQASEIEEHGILTDAGKYKLWKETIALSYLGIAPKE